MKATQLVKQNASTEMGRTESDVLAATGLLYLQANVPIFDEISNLASSNLILPCGSTTGSTTRTTKVEEVSPTAQTTVPTVFKRRQALGWNALIEA
ncbi:uncharacterized protein ALTATR162_LOCUS11710 [Alternaria atra]|uniref:Uncharacterized protein n=1 Tax=Alternaria atra TaxID=119953 RepID=A0A8J2NBP7_9PLEO|nr:uncharacterized protein ALTATR162_LOCUS11710 [Alternaria atra]CAG5187406.1 unnamed protein product [Alternaria atra]